MKSLTFLVLFAAAIAATSCVSGRFSTQTCAMILVMDGIQVLPSQSQFDAIGRKLQPQFEAKNLVLVPHVAGADLVATIECVSHQDSAVLTNLVVRSIEWNSFVTRKAMQTIPADMPSLREAEREHQKALMNR